MRSPEEIHEVVRDRYGDIARKGTPVAGCCGPSAAQIAERIGYSATDTAAVPDGANLGLGCGDSAGHAAVCSPARRCSISDRARASTHSLRRAPSAPTGRVIGVDMTARMLAKARGNAERAGHRNVEFRKATSKPSGRRRRVDVIISNCVINLSPDKPARLREVDARAPSGRPHGGERRRARSRPCPIRSGAT